MPQEKTVELKTKLKAADCAAYLNQFTSETGSSTKPLTGWVANQSFELAPSHSGLFGVQSIGKIDEADDGATVHLQVQMSRTSKLLLTISACLILGAFAALILSYLQSIDVFGFSWAFLFLVVIPSTIWLTAFFAIRRAVQNKQDPFINTICSSLQAQKVQFPTTKLNKTIVVQRPKGKRIQSGHVLSTAWLALHAIPLFAGFGFANYATEYLHNRAWEEWAGGEYAQSENYCRPIMQLTELFYSGDQSRQAHAYYILAENLRCQQKWDEALQYYNKARVLQENTLDRSDPTLAWTYDNIGKIYDANNNPQAADYYSKALDIWKKAKYPEEALIARTLNRLALFHARQKEASLLELAEEEQLEALGKDRSRFPSVDGKYGKTVAEDLNDLGVIYLAESKIPEATKALKEAIEIKEAHNESDQDKISLANSYVNYFHASSKQKQQAPTLHPQENYLLKAEKLYKSAGILMTPATAPLIITQIDKKVRPHLEFPNLDRRTDTRIDWF